MIDKSDIVSSSDSGIIAVYYIFSIGSRNVFYFGGKTGLLLIVGCGKIRIYLVICNFG